jgi:hypothetical protein
MQAGESIVSPLRPHRLWKVYIAMSDLDAYNNFTKTINYLTYEKENECDLKS